MEELRKAFKERALENYNLLIEATRLKNSSHGDNLEEVAQISAALEDGMKYLNDLRQKMVENIILHEKRLRNDDTEDVKRQKQEIKKEDQTD